ncbi:putative nuclease of restriction endonuclease-like (RecB) superfamily [Pedobacter africanus]|uniref:Nuclease of restriction endonuclease-like (RecB) superfamily n=1 Tax=Pedobacter africanus TaxID=151894 RepID=A0ACC6KXF8_9SPHI|nr:PDDEXK nuclease domain-containing protein [Pedobacter africanus]MDR6783783.1 putative nuclease of restriction endonuclease-like (RecB) superfamily [Pedobacter africanus]
MNKIIQDRDYNDLVGKISTRYKNGQVQAVQAVNIGLLETYWQIGQYIVEFEQGGAERAAYGKSLINNLSDDLSILHGKGFSRSNLIYMRLLYLEYPIGEKPSHLLSWSHYVELLKIDDKLERSFYEQQSIIEKWSIPELKRQKKSSLFLRLAVSKNKDQILQLARKGQAVNSPIDIIREPYVLDFLKIPEPHHYTESELEKRIIEHLQHFLLELGKGFAFIGRQYRITLGNRHHYVDLVFYHRILKCFVLIDLKKEEAGYQDIGQMNMYLGYFENEENTEGDNSPIGIVLAKEKDDLLIQYAMHNVSSQLFVSKYQFYLPDKDQLRAVIEEQLNDNKSQDI